MLFVDKAGYRSAMVKIEEVPRDEDGSEDNSFDLGTEDLMIAFAVYDYWKDADASK